MKFGLNHNSSRRQIEAVLEEHGIRATSQRIDIASVLLAKPQHLSAEQVFGRVNTKSELVSKATIYNTLNLFVDRGLINQVVIDCRYVFYDSNTEPHQHFYNEGTGALQDIDDVVIKEIPELPRNTVQTGIDVIIRVKSQS